MTCRKCLHAPVCFDSEGCTKYYGLEIAANNVEELCIHFVDRSRYVVREAGEWELVEFQSSPLDADQALVCSCCGFAHQYDACFNICPNCGADMTGGDRRV
jgi:hypothetical protein